MLTTPHFFFQRSHGGRIKTQKMADDNDNSNSVRVQLGFALPIINTNNDDESYTSSEYDDNNPPPLCHQSPHWSNWDGGKIGGLPSWLNPRDIPTQILRCRNRYCSGSSSSTSSSDGANSKGGDVSINNSNEGTALTFIAQLYCPADDVTHNENAFHRTLYVFACPTCCTSQSLSTILEKEKEMMGEVVDEKENNELAIITNHYLSNCIRVLRCQLPKENDFYPLNGNDINNNEEEEWVKHKSPYWAKNLNNDKLNLCAICGQRSRGKCPKQNKWFCGINCQKECLRASKKKKKLQEGTNNNNNDDDIISSAKYLSSVCYESELVVEEEPVSPPVTTTNTECTAANLTTSTNDGTLFPSKDFTTDADANLEQSDLNAMIAGNNESLAQAATGVTDPTTLDFYARMSIGGSDNDVRDQCLRYCRWPDMVKNLLEENELSTSSYEDYEEEDEKVGTGPLWLSSNHLPPPSSVQSTIAKASSTKGDDITSVFPPPCQYCGAPRSFEFQILPQMLHYLLHSPESTTTITETDNNNRQVLTEAERAVLLEAKSKIESGVELPIGFKEQHDKVVANARESLLLGVGFKGKTTIATTAQSLDQGIGGGSWNKGLLDWGTIAVYTCTASCGTGRVTGVDENGAYMEEAAWMQPPLD